MFGHFIHVAFAFFMLCFIFLIANILNFELRIHYFQAEILGHGLLSLTFVWC